MYLHSGIDSYMYRLRQIINHSKSDTYLRSIHLQVICNFCMFSYMYIMNIYSRYAQTIYG